MAERSKIRDEYECNDIASENYGGTTNPCTESRLWNEKLILKNERNRMDTGIHSEVPNTKHSMGESI